jgi:serine/threonine protein kinase
VRKELEYFALKKFDLKNPDNSNYDLLLMEINSLLQARNEENIIKYVDYYYDKDDECVCLILELCEGGNLEQAVANFKHRFPGCYISEVVWL